MLALLLGFLAMTAVGLVAYPLVKRMFKADVWWILLSAIAASILISLVAIKINLIYQLTIGQLLGLALVLAACASSVIVGAKHFSAGLTSEASLAFEAERTEKTKKVKKEKVVPESAVRGEGTEELAGDLEALMGEVYKRLETSDQESAIRLLESATMATTDRETLILLNIELGRAYFTAGRLDEALVKLKKGLTLCQEVGNIELSREIRGLLQDMKLSG